MAAPSSATITGQVGGVPATITAKVFTNVTQFHLDIVNTILFITWTPSGDNSPVTTQVAIASATTWTVTQSSGVFSITVS